MNITLAVSVIYLFVCITSLCFLTYSVTAHTCFPLTVFQMFAKELIRMRYIFWGHWTIDNQIGTYHALKVFLRWMSKHFLEMTCLDDSFDLLLGITFRIFSDGFNQDYGIIFVVLQVQVVSSTFVQNKLSCSLVWVHL